MKRYKFLTPVIAVILAASMSCSDGYEKEPLELVTIQYVFNELDSAGTYAVLFLNDIYAMLTSGHNRVGSDYLDAASDDAISINNDDPDVYLLVMGRYSSTSRVTSDMIWSDPYKAVRKVNILINNIDVVPFIYTYTDSQGNTQPLNVTMKAEARFIRAYFYFELVKRYGGVPLMGDEVHELGDYMEYPRNTFEECIDYIVSELDDIKDDLRTWPCDDYGTYAHCPTREACIALKSRVLLYAASPLFNENPIESGNELVGYASYDIERWNLASQAARQFIEEYGPDGNGSYGLTSNFRNIFLNFWNISSNPEIIWWNNSGSGTTIENDNGPLGFTGNAQGKGRTLPTQNLVDAYPMIDGRYSGEGSSYYMTSTNQYANRDPRLELTVLHHGQTWLQQSLDLSDGGTHNPTSSAEYCKTGYYMCKFMDDFSTEEEYSSHTYMWVVLRYAEILLNFAEAENEYLDEPSQEVYDAIIAIRARAGIEAGDDGMYGLDEGMTKEEMREVIQNERRLEMAFEEQRYWDIRRWRLAESIFEEPLQGMYIKVTSGNTTYNVQDVLTTSFAEKQYLYPIPYEEVVENSNMVQNPQW